MTYHHSCIVYAREWENGARIEVLYYPETQDGFEPQDRIRLMVTAAGQTPRGWLMDVEDAMTVIAGLSLAVNAAMRDQLPPYPIDVEGFDAEKEALRQEIKMAERFAELGKRDRQRLEEENATLKARLQEPT